MRIEIDKQADAAFIYFKEISPGEVAKTISLDGNINVDLDANGQLLGMEILRASKIMPKQAKIES